jgi:hypothetical protein
VAAIDVVHLDFVARLDLSQQGEVGVAMGGVDRCAPVAGVGRANHVARTESQGLAAGAIQYDHVAMQARKGDPRHRPGVGPRPGLDLFARGERPFEGPLQQRLGQHRLGGNPQAQADHGATTSRKRTSSAAR